MPNNDNKVIDAHDDALNDAGRFGVGRRPISMIELDDLTATAK